MNQPRISLCMIVRDEERFLGNCLNSIQGAVDEICIVDTGSTDATLDIARMFGAKIGHFPWNDSFCEARNAALAMATGDWILSLDADERLAPLHWQMIRKMSIQSPPDCHGIFFNCISATAGPIDVSPVLRMFRNLPHIRYENRVHEEVGMTIQRAGGAMGQSQICITHDGYIPDIVVGRQKWDRNERLLLLEIEAQPESGFMQYNMGHHWLVKGEKEKAIPHFAESLKLSSAANLYWERLVEESRIAGIVVEGPGVRVGYPIDPVSLGLHPDPLMRAA